MDKVRSGYSVRGFDTDKEKNELIEKIKTHNPEAKTLFKTTEELRELLKKYEPSESNLQAGRRHSN